MFAMFDPPPNDVGPEVSSNQLGLQQQLDALHSRLDSMTTAMAMGITSWVLNTFPPQLAPTAPHYAWYVLMPSAWLVCLLANRRFREYVARRYDWMQFVPRVAWAGTLGIGAMAYVAVVILTIPVFRAMPLDTPELGGGIEETKRPAQETTITWLDLPNSSTGVETPKPPAVAKRDRPKKDGVVVERRGQPSPLVKPQLAPPPPPAPTLTAPVAPRGLRIIGG